MGHHGAQKSWLYYALKMVILLPSDISKCPKYSLKYVIPAGFRAGVLIWQGGLCKVLLLCDTFKFLEPGIDQITSFAIVLTEICNNQKSDLKVAATLQVQPSLHGHVKFWH
jgi:hypothetical protein